MELEKKDYEFTKEAKSEADKKMESEGIPIYMERLDLSQEQKDRLVKEIFAELDVIKKERVDKNLEKKWTALDNQYEGKLQEDTRRQFNLNKNVTKVKIDKIEKYIKQALFEIDPLYSVSPRPEFVEANFDLQVCERQQDFLDYKLDNLPFVEPMDLVIHSSVNKGAGILKIFHDIKIENRKREESYKATLVPVIDPTTKGPVIDPQTGIPAMENKGLKDFLSNWPNAEKDYPGYVRQLQEGKDISFVAQYKDPVYNDPRPKYVDLKDFYVRLNTDGLQGLKSTKLIGERQNYTYWELKKEEKNEKFYDIDKLTDDPKEKDGKVKNYETMDFDVFEFTYYFKLKENEDEVKVTVWIEEKKKIVVGSILYPYYAIDACYIPFYIKKKETGFYQPGVAEDLTDNNLAENALLNLTLESAYISNTVTPITKNSEVHNQFLEKRFTHGIPIDASAGDVDFLQKYMKPPDIGGLIALMQMLSLNDDDVSGISAGMSGKENPMDPSAPASKTIALLKASSIDIKDYINHIVPSFNEIGYILLAMYYQISKEGRKYTINPARVVGTDPFGVLERNDMVARTNIQARAYLFDFEKAQENQKDLALYQTLRMEPLVAKNPEAVYTLLKSIAEGWSPKWKALSAKIIPSMDDFKKQNLQAALQGVALYVNSVLENSKTTGVKPEFDVNALLPVVADLRAQLVTAPDPRTMKEQENAQV